MPNKKIYDVESVASWFISTNQNDPKPSSLTNKKLQKLLYYTQAVSLAFNDEIFFNADFEAWVHGPAIPKIYQKYREWGFHQIRDEKSNKVQTENFEIDDLNILQVVWHNYGKYDADYLEALTHSELPWQKARGDAEEYMASNSIIDTEVMKKYYKEKYKVKKS